MTERLTGSSGAEILRAAHRMSEWGAVMERVRAALGPSGRPLYLAGGAVRDRLLGREPRDLDLLVEAPPAEQSAVLSDLSRLAAMDPVLFDRRPPVTHRFVVDGVEVDVSFFPPGRIDPALRRRDFTLNAMALRLPVDDAGLRASVIDPAGGLADLDARRIVVASEGSLDEDPLRMLRGVRLEATLPGFRMTPDLDALVRERSARIRESAAERVSAEIEMIFRTGSAGPSIRRMDGLGLLAPLLPELEPLRGLRQPAKHHDHDAFDHTLRALDVADRLAEGSTDLSLPALAGEDVVVLKWAALLHDCGKAATATIDEAGQPHFYGHETVSASLAEDALRRLRVPGRIAEPVVSLIDLHLRAGMLAGASVEDRPIRRLARAAGARLPLLALLSLADRRASGGQRAQEKEEALLQILRRALSVSGEVEAMATAPPLLHGEEIMAILGLPPGPRVGSILRWLDRLRADGRIRTREEAESLLKSLPPQRLEKRK